MDRATNHFGGFPPVSANNGQSVAERTHSQPTPARLDVLRPSRTRGRQRRGIAAFSHACATGPTKFGEHLGRKVARTSVTD